MSLLSGKVAATVKVKKKKRDRPGMIKILQLMKKLKVSLLFTLVGRIIPEWGCIWRKMGKVYG